jgi:hypothetical protein
MFVGILEGKRLFGGTMRGWEDNIKILEKWDVRM